MTGSEDRRVAKRERRASLAVWGMLLLIVCTASTYSMPLPRFQRLPPERRAHLLETAATDFAEKGFEAASLNEILAKAGFGKSSYYYYFEDKEDLYVASVTDALARLVPTGMALSLSSLTRKSFWPKVEGWFDSLIALSISQPIYMALIRDAPAMRKMLGPRTQELAQRVFLPAVECIRRGQELGCIRHDLDAEQLWVVGMAADAALDEEFFVRTDAVTPAAVKQHGRLVLDTWQRLLAPAPAQPPRKSKR